MFAFWKKKKFSRNELLSSDWISETGFSQFLLQVRAVGIEGGKGDTDPPPPDFGRSVNPISTRAMQIRPTTLRLILPDFQTFLRSWIRCGIKSNHYHYHETKNYWQHPAECMLLLFTRVGHNFEQKLVCIRFYIWKKNYTFDFLSMPWTSLNIPRISANFEGKFYVLCVIES